MLIIFHGSNKSLHVIAILPKLNIVNDIDKCPRAIYAIGVGVARKMTMVTVYRQLKFSKVMKFQSKIST